MDDQTSGKRARRQGRLQSEQADFEVDNEWRLPSGQDLIAFALGIGAPSNRGPETSTHEDGFFATRVVSSRRNRSDHSGD